MPQVALYGFVYKYISDENQQQEKYYKHFFVFHILRLWWRVHPQDVVFVLGGTLSDARGMKGELYPTTSLTSAMFI